MGFNKQFPKQTLVDKNRRKFTTEDDKILGLLNQYSIKTTLAGQEITSMLHRTGFY